MRFIRGCFAAAALVLAGCGEDAPAPRGPVTVKFATPTYPKPGGGRDTAFAQVTMDGQVTSTAPTESLTNVPRGTHVFVARSEEHTSELQSLAYLVCRLLLEKKKKK